MCNFLPNQTVWWYFIQVVIVQCHGNPTQHSLNKLTWVGNFPLFKDMIMWAFFYHGDLRHYLKDNRSDQWSLWTANRSKQHCKKICKKLEKLKRDGVVWKLWIVRHLSCQRVSCQGLWWLEISLVMFIWRDLDSFLQTKCRAPLLVPVNALGKKPYFLTFLCSRSIAAGHIDGTLKTEDSTVQLFINVYVIWIDSNSINSKHF